MRNKNFILGGIAFLEVMFLAAGNCGRTMTVDAASSGKSSEQPTAQEQLNVIESQKEVWGKQDEMYSYSLSYMVADLDQDGYLEIIASSVSGTGLYTTSEFYEVNRAGNKTECCSYDVPEGDSEADLSFSDSVPYYYDSSSNTYYYIFTDTVSASASENYVSTIAVSMKDGVVTTKALGTKETVFTNSDPVVTFYKSDGTVITEQEYDALADEVFSGMEKGEAEFGWFCPYNSDMNARNAAELSDDKLLEQLSVSWNKFYVSR